MLEQIIYDITTALLYKRDVDREALLYHFGSEEITDEVIAGIQRAMDDYEAEMRFKQLRGYTG